MAPLQLMRPGAEARLFATAVAIGLLWLAFGTQESLPQLARGAEDWSGDFRDYYLPNAEFAAASLAEGRLPLWNPHQGAGGPLLATIQPGVLYPPNWLHLLLPAEVAFLALTALHLSLGAFLAGCLARRFGAADLGAAVAGVGYATSVQVLGSIYTPPLVYTAAWLPGVLLAVDAIIDRPTPRRAAGLAGIVALQALAGWPYTVALTALAAALYALPLLGARAYHAGEAPWRAALAFAAAGAAAGLLAAPQLLPALELLSRSCRALGSVIESQAIFVDPPHDPALFFRNLFNHGVNDAVPGWISLVLASLAIALRSPRRGRLALLLGIGGFGLLASFPNHLPVYGWLRELPLLGDFRFPYRYRLLSTLALAIAAGAGTTALQRALVRRQWTARVAGLGALALLVLTATAPTLRGVTPFARSFGPPRSVSEKLADIGVSWRPDPFQRVFWTGIAHKIRAPGSDFVIHDMEPLTLARTAQLLTYFETGRPSTLLTLRPPKGRKREDWVAAPFFGWLNVPARSQRAAILDVFSIGTIVTAKPPGWLARRYERLTPPEAELSVFHNPHALPRAYLAATARQAPAKLPAALRLLTSDSFDPRVEVLLDDVPPQLLERSGSAAVEQLGRVAIREYRAERVTLRTSAPVPGIAVLTDAFFPGWYAFLDGEPVELLRANLNFRGVVVPAGDHVIEMHYQPRSLRWGAALAATGALACGALWLVGRRDSA